MKTLCLLFFISTAAYHSKGQLTWAPLGATWHYEYGGMMFYGYIRSTVAGDTIVENQLCKKIETVAFIVYPISYPNGTTTYPPPIIQNWPAIYTYADSNRVFRWTGTEFEVLYDFSLIIGDSYLYPGENLTALVTDTGTLNINGFDLRYYDIEIQDVLYPHSRRFIEYIGSHDDFLIPSFWNSTDPDWVGIRCYDDLSFGSYDFTLGGIPFCDYLPTEINEIEKLNV